MGLEILKEHRAEMQLQIFKDEPLMSDKDIAYDKWYNLCYRPLGGC